MKKNFLYPSIAFLSSICSLHAQTPFNTIDSVNINKINAAVLVHGDMWWNPDPTDYQPKCIFPNGSKKHLNFTSALWMSGFDGTGQLHVAAQTYRINGNDFWPGPLNSSDTLTYATSAEWAKIWKVNRTDIQYFQSLVTHTTTNTPTEILRWPAKGNIYAQGNAGVSLTITGNMAPFVDVNSNGNYEPLLGEYPDVKGDQALWWAFSDNGPTHTQSNGKPLGVEIHAMSYAYNRGTLIDYVVYYEYTIINRSSNTYNSFRIGQWTDTEIGYYLDDYIGFDSTWRMGITYNGTNDDGGGAGHPTISYGVNPPQSAITMIVLPGDAGTSYVPAGSFVYHNNDNSIIGNPSVDSQYSNYMRAKLRNGTHFTNDFSGAGVPCKGFGSGADCNYVFTGDPSINTQWSMCSCNSNPGDLRPILSSNDFTLSAGGQVKVVFALIVADSAGGCGVANYNKIKVVADTAWKNYFNPPAPLPPNAITNLETPHLLHICPNPANTKLFIDATGSDTGKESITVYNALGQIINISLSRSGKRYEADITELPVGLYNILYRCRDAYTTAKFIKE
ncbi:MAG: hypothetical protein K0Q79_643 [Flavipsychrobacter sp.]|jgi:hypothetical protein|nr:hypothetical protein [Flavipsychrobacter sp.]